MWYQCLCVHICTPCTDVHVCSCICMCSHDNCSAYVVVHCKWYLTEDCTENAPARTIVCLVHWCQDHGATSLNRKHVEPACPRLSAWTVPWPTCNEPRQHPAYRHAALRALSMYELKCNVNTKSHVLLYVAANTRVTISLKTKSSR